MAYIEEDQFDCLIRAVALLASTLSVEGHTLDCGSMTREQTTDKFIERAKAFEKFIRTGDVKS